MIIELHFVDPGTLAVSVGPFTSYVSPLVLKPPFSKARMRTPQSTCPVRRSRSLALILGG